ncbi:MAG: DUF4214 domain-containing protein [Clostridiales bacterium]|nr:DUF4214 domain-containing protein [Clostridiales bacterium]
MSTAGIKEKFTEVPGYLFAPSLIFMLTAFFAQQTPVFDALPSEFGAIARLVAAAVGVLGIIIAPRKDTVNLTVVCAVLTAVGIAVMYESGITYVFDIALMVLLFSQADVKDIAVTVFSFFACVTGATAICAYKGYIKSFTLYGRYTFGFRNLAGLYLSAAAIIICLVLMIVVWVREKETLKLIIRFAFSAVLSAALVVMCLKALNLAAAVEPGTYPIYFGDTDYALEVRMKGFEDYQIGFGEDEATPFVITPDGDNYLITMDSYGVTKTLCVIDERVFAGNYDQSESAHEWNIRAIAGTPYCLISNVETGLYLSMNDDGQPALVTEPSDESVYMRIGLENIEYYTDRTLEGLQTNDMRLAEITVTPNAKYTGAAVTPDEITVVMNGKELVEGRDYTVSCWNNLIPGTAWADIRGVGDYTGVQGVSFDLIYGDDRCDDPFYRDTADYIVRMYRMGYYRLPSFEDVQGNLRNLIGSNQTPDSVIWDIYRYGGLNGSNAQFMEAVYRLVLLRNGSRGELDAWIAELDRGANRGDIIDSITESPDYQNIWHNFGIGFR